MKTSLGGNILAYLDLGANLNPGLDAAVLHMEMVGAGANLSAGANRGATMHVGVQIEVHILVWVQISILVWVQI